MSVNKDSKYNKSLKGLYRQFTMHSRLKGQKVPISFKEYVKLRNKNCHYCNGSLPVTGHGIDRINSLKGYIKGNLRPCCTVCNQAKNNLSTKTFKLHILAIYNHWICK